MAFFKKKPVTVEAFSFDELKNVMLQKEDLDTGHFFFRSHQLWYSDSNDYFSIPTLEGDMAMTSKDMLIVGIDGEIYPCKIDIFNRTYDVIDNDNTR